MSGTSYEYQSGIMNMSVIYRPNSGKQGYFSLFFTDEKNRLNRFLREPHFPPGVFLPGGISGNSIAGNTFFLRAKSLGKQGIFSYIYLQTGTIFPFIFQVLFIDAQADPGIETHPETGFPNDPVSEAAPADHHAARTAHFRRDRDESHAPGG
ncbi:MAG: hypothetical protein ACYC9O_14135 [Candidatus Latescibacterota bacterium]